MDSLTHVLDNNKNYTFMYGGNIYFDNNKITENYGIWNNRYYFWDTKSNIWNYNNIPISNENLTNQKQKIIIPYVGEILTIINDNSGTNININQNNIEINVSVVQVSDIKIYIRSDENIVRLINYTITDDNGTHSTEFSGPKLGNFVIPQSIINDTTIYIIPFILPNDQRPIFIKSIKMRGSQYYVKPIEHFQNSYITNTSINIIGQKDENNKWWNVIFELSDDYNPLYLSFEKETPQEYYNRIINHEDNLNIDIGIIPSYAENSNISPLLEVLTIPIVVSDTEDTSASLKDNSKFTNANVKSTIINKYLHGKPNVRPGSFITGANDNIDKHLYYIQESQVKNIYLTLDDTESFKYKNLKSGTYGNVYTNISTLNNSTDIFFIISELNKDNSIKSIPLIIPLSKYQNSSYRLQERIKLFNDDSQIYVPGFISDSKLQYEDISNFNIIVTYDSEDLGQNVSSQP